MDVGIPGVTDAVEVGRGGFAVVYRAVQPAFERTVAVKILNASPDPSNLERFRREVTAIGRLGEHPAITPVLDVGVTTSGHHYLLMPFLSGGSLEDALRRGQRLSPGEAAELGIVLAGALHAAHEAGILHRDVKPANLMRGRYGDVRLVDFGIARVTGGYETTDGVPIATWAHAAPEICDGKAPSTASDLYALGSTLYTLVAGRSPFSSSEDDSLLSLIGRIFTQPVPPLPPGPGAAALEVVLKRAMAKDPAERYGSGQEMAEALRQVAVAVDEPTTTLAEADRPGAPAPPAAQTTPPAGGKGRRLAAVGGALVLLAVVVTVALLARKPDGGAPPADDVAEEERSEAGGAEPTPGATGEPSDEAPEQPTEEASEDAAEDAAEEPTAEVTTIPPAPAATGAASPAPPWLGGVSPADLSRLDEMSDPVALEPDVRQDVAVDPGAASVLRFQVPEGRPSLRVAVFPEDPVDTFAGVYRNGELLVANHDQADDLFPEAASSPLIELPDLAAGDYELRLATAFDVGGTVSVLLQVVPTQQVPDGGDSLTLADNLDLHVYRVEAEQGGATGLAVEGDSEILLRATLRSGRDITRQNGSGRTVLNLLESIGPDTYFVYVTSAAPRQTRYSVELLG